MDPWVQNRSCDPFTPREQPCTLGNYVDYAINVSCAADALAGVQFAQKNNIRLVVKNTGHECVPLLLSLLKIPDSPEQVVWI